MGTPAPHPIRLVISDDLQRSRLTVFFRILLAIPHLLWIGLFGVATVAVVFLNWWATLFAGQSPKGFHGFLAGYVRYVTQVDAYLFLAANPYPPFYLGDMTEAYPIDVEIDPPAPQHRAVTFFRLFLALPALLLSGALTGGPTGYGGSGYYRMGGGIAGTAAVLIWFAALVRGRAPRGLRDLAAWGVGYGAHLAGYLFILTDRYPTSDPLAHLATVAPTPATAEELLPPLPARGIVADDVRRSRLTVFFRLLLWLPHLVWWALWTVVAWIVAIANWVAALVLGRAPRPLARFLSAYVRYTVHQYAFISIVGGPFPGFTGTPGSYPIDLEVDPFGPQKRLTVLFRLLLAIPALAINTAATGLLVVVAVLGWFAALVLGWMPRGLRNAGAWAVTYNGQFDAYVFVLSDRYPFSSPLAVSWRA